MKNRFLKSFPTLGNYMEAIKAQARRQGKVRTVGGRTRLLPHIASANRDEKAKAERQAINSTIQGSAADVMKEAMLRCRDELHRRRLPAVLLAQIHDELLFEVAAPLLPAVARCVKECMETIQLDGDGQCGLPPLPVNLVAGAAWGSMQPVPVEEGEGAAGPGIDGH